MDLFQHPCNKVPHLFKTIFFNYPSFLGMDDSLDFSTSQDSFYEDNSEFDIPISDEFARNMGLSRGKPYNVTKVAKKRLGFSVCATGRTKGK